MPRAPTWLALRAGETGSLRVGTYQSVGARVLPEVMRRFRADWPEIELGLSEPSTDPELYGAIESGDLDLAFCSPPLPDGPFETARADERSRTCSSSPPTIPRAGARHRCRSQISATSR